MSTPDMIDKTVEVSYFLANILVFGFATAGYRECKKRSLLMIAVSSAIGTVLCAAPWIRADEPSWGFWGFHTVASMCDLVLYVAGFSLLFRDYVALVLKTARPSGGTPKTGDET